MTQEDFEDLIDTNTSEMELLNTRIHNLEQRKPNGYQQLINSLRQEYKELEDKNQRLTQQYKEQCEERVQLKDYLKDFELDDFKIEDLQEIVDGDYETLEDISKSIEKLQRDNLLSVAAMVLINELTESLASKLGFNINLMLTCLKLKEERDVLKESNEMNKLLGVESSSEPTFDSVFGDDSSNETGLDSVFPENTELENLREENKNLREQLQFDEDIIESDIRSYKSEINDLKNRLSRAVAILEGKEDYE